MSSSTWTGEEAAKLAADQRSQPWQTENYGTTYTDTVPIHGGRLLFKVPGYSIPVQLLPFTTSLPFTSQSNQALWTQFNLPQDPPYKRYILLNPNASNATYVPVTLNPIEGLGSADVVSPSQVGAHADDWSLELPLDALSPKTFALGLTNPVDGTKVTFNVDVGAPIVEPTLGPGEVLQTPARLWTAVEVTSPNGDKFQFILPLLVQTPVETTDPPTPPAPSF